MDFVKWYWYTGVCGFRSFLWTLTFLQSIGHIFWASVCPTFAHTKQLGCSHVGGSCSKKVWLFGVPVVPCSFSINHNLWDYCKTSQRPTIRFISFCYPSAVFSFLLILSRGRGLDFFISHKFILQILSYEIRFSSIVAFGSAMSSSKYLACKKCTSGFCSS